MEQQELIVDGKALVPRPNGAEPQSLALTPADLLHMAVVNGADIDKLTKLMELQERWEANNARHAYNSAIAKFKANPPEIIKNKHVKFGNTEYDHPTLDHVTATITKALSDVGIGFRWDVQQNGSEIAVTCILTHELGHCEKTTLKATPDTSGSKNAIQAIGSAVTYLQRYTLMAACGMAAREMDDDGQDSGMGNAWIAERCDWIKNCRNKEELSKFFKDAFKEAGKANDTKALAQLMSAHEARKAELA